MENQSKSGTTSQKYGETQLLLSSTTNPLNLREFLEKKLTKKVNLDPGQQSSAKILELKFEQIVDKKTHINL